MTKYHIKKEDMETFDDEHFEGEVLDGPETPDGENEPVLLVRCPLMTHTVFIIKKRRPFQPAQEKFLQQNTTSFTVSYVTVQQEKHPDFSGSPLITGI
jgi:hypothetical protein